MANSVSVQGETLFPESCDQFNRILFQSINRGEPVSDVDAKFIRTHWNHCPSRIHSDEFKKESAERRKKKTFAPAKEIELELQCSPRFAQALATVISTHGKKQDELIHQILSSAS